MPISLSDRDPGLITRLDDSLERARNVAMLSPDGASKLGGAGLEAAAVKELAEFRKKEPNRYLFEEITDIVVRLEFRKAMRRAEDFFAKGKIETPTDEDILKSDVDIEGLSIFYKDLQANGIVPGVILAPHGLGLSAWENLYSELSKENPATLSGLWVGPTLRNNWDKFDTNYTNNSIGPIIEDRNGRTWSMSVINALPQPNKNYVNYYGNSRDTERRSKPTISNDRYPTISEYLTLQALSFKAGSFTIDGSGYHRSCQTWIHADTDDVLISNQPSAPTGAYFGPTSKVILNLFAKRNSFNAGIREVYR